MNSGALSSIEMKYRFFPESFGYYFFYTWLCTRAICVARIFGSNNNRIMAIILKRKHFSFNGYEIYLIASIRRCWFNLWFEHISKLLMFLDSAQMNKLHTGLNTSAKKWSVTLDRGTSIALNVSFKYRTYSLYINIPEKCAQRLYK